MTGLLKKLKQDNQGAAMAVALLCVLVLSLLGTALWQYFMADTNFAAKDEKGMQAYYVARAGADAVAQYIIKNPDNMTEQQLNNFVTTISAVSASNPVDFGKGNFKVSVKKNADNSLEIQSNGEVGDTTKKVTLSLVPITVPPTPGDALDANGSLNWLNGNSFNVKKKIDANSNKPVKFNPGNGAEHLEVQPQGEPDFTAPGLYFEHQVTIDNPSTLSLTANIIVFNGKLTLNEKQGNSKKDSSTGQLHLEGLYDSSTGTIINGKTYGKVYFGGGVYVGTQQVIPPGGYYFPANCVLPPLAATSNTNWDYEDAGLIFFGTVSGYDMIWK